jgi:hypothetical protein
MFSRFDNLKASNSIACNSTFSSFSLGIQAGLKQVNSGSFSIVLFRQGLAIFFYN